MNDTNGNNQRPVVPLMPRPQLPRPQSEIAQRTAAAFAEIKQLEDRYTTLEAENANLRRTVDQQANKIELLEKSVTDERYNGRIYQRKLIRLAASMAGINALTAEADKIMRDVKEVDEAQADIDKDSGRLNPLPQD